MPPGSWHRKHWTARCAVPPVHAKIIRATSAGARCGWSPPAPPGTANAADFVRGVEEVLGVTPEVLSGQDEAYLSFTGATAELAASDRPSAGPESLPGGPYLVVDIGGGLTEFVLGGGLRARHPAARTGINALSVDIGCVRLTERQLDGYLPARAEIAAAVADTEAALDRVAAAMPAATARTLVGLAGSVTTIAGLALGLAEYDPSRIHHARIPAAQVAEQTRALLGQTRS